MFPLVQVKNDIEIEGFHNIYYFEFGKNHYHPTEKHEFWEMVYVDKGKILANTNGNICTLEEGQAIFHGPGETHAHVSDKEVSNNLLVVSFSCKGICAEYFSGKIFNLDKTGKMLLSLFIGEAKNALGNISGDFHSCEPLVFNDTSFGASQLMKYHFAELLIKLYRGGISDVHRRNEEVSRRTGENNDFVEKVIKYLEDNVYSEVTLDDICNTFFVRKSRLSVVFKQHTGKSPMHYFKNLKTEEAKKLLREETLPVSRICEMLGYSGIHNFTRSFKAATGFSPTGYRKSVLLLLS